MSSAAEPQTPANLGVTPAGNRQLTSMVDMLSKSVAALAIALYASGFLIVSLRDSRFGFIETNPFRPKILAAGAWFFLFIGIPIITVAAAKKNLFTRTSLGQFLLPYFMGCVALTFSASPLFTLAFDRTFEWKTFVMAIVVGILVFLRIGKFPRIVSEIGAIVFVISALVSTIREMLVTHNFDQNAIVLWFFGVGIGTLLALFPPERFWYTAEVQTIRDFTNLSWTNTLFTILGSLIVFSLFYYPRIKPSLGGGSPINAVLYFTKDSAIKPNQSVSAQLVDESDAGFYIVGQGESKAIFVPRSSVSLVYFSDKSSDSELLR